MADEKAPDHQFLALKPGHRGEMDARSIVYEQLGVLLGPVLPKIGPADPIPLVGRAPLPPFMELVKITKATGVPGPLQQIIDMSDPVFGGIAHSATNSQVMSWTINIADTKRTVPGPSYIAQACDELADDILAFRRLTCAHSMRSDIRWADIGRAYRGLLFASTAILEAFMNRHLLAARLSGVDITSVEKESKFADRATAWMDLYSPGSATAVKSGKPWSQHMELREERNAILHARLPSLGLSLKEVPKYLNAVREGVGGLLWRLQRLRGGPRLGFMLRLASAPEISFVPYRDPATGQAEGTGGPREGGEKRVGGS
jgi:hypothetical protein